VSIAGGATTRYVDQTFSTTFSDGSDVPAMPPWALVALAIALIGAAAISLRVDVKFRLHCARIRGR
jgi:hypothetical protein